MSKNENSAPRRARAIAFVALFSTVAGIVANLAMNESYVLGEVSFQQDTEDGGRTVVSVEVPFVGDRILVGSRECLADLTEGAWVISKGDVRRLDSHEYLEVAQRPRRLPLIPSIIRGAAGEVPEQVGGLLVSDSRVAVVGAAMIALAGLFVLRIFLTLASGLFGSVVTWNLASVATLENLIRASEEMTLAIAASGFLLGAALGWRRGDGAGPRVERLLLALVILALAAPLAIQVGVSVTVMRVVGPVFALLTPALGLCLPAGALLIHGLDAQGAAVPAIFVLSAAVAALVSGIPFRKSKLASSRS